MLHLIGNNATTNFLIILEDQLLFFWLTPVTYLKCVGKGSQTEKAVSCSNRKWVKIVKKLSCRLTNQSLKSETGWRKGNTWWRWKTHTHTHARTRAHAHARTQYRMFLVLKTEHGMFNCILCHHSTIFFLHGKITLPVIRTDRVRNYSQLFLLFQLFLLNNLLVLFKEAIVKMYKIHQFPKGIKLDHSEGSVSKWAHERLIFPMLKLCFMYLL